MISIRLLALAVFLVLTATTHVKQRRFNSDWITSGQHDNTCFTQGLSFINSTHMLESCGIYGLSFFHILEFTLNDNNETYLTQTYRSNVFPDDIFLEGSILFPKNQLIYILTWQQKIVYRFNSADFSQVDTLQWTGGEGWGMTHNQSHIFISTGSNEIFICDEDLNILEVLPILDEQNNPLMNINELEWVEVDGQQYIYANIWMKSEIVKISIAERNVAVRFIENKMVVNSKGKQYGREQDVLNGIAIDNARNVFILTGKKWPRYYVTALDLIRT